jgi:hypothetical protein
MIGQRHATCVESLKKSISVLTGTGLDQDCFQGGM